MAEIIRGTKESQFIHNCDCDQLCWKCANAYGDCDWSREFKPIEGWTADTVYKEGYKGRIQFYSYNIHECPQFVPDTKRHKIEMDDEALKDFVYLIFTEACNDWIRFYKDKKRTQRQMTTCQFCDIKKYNDEIIKINSELRSIEQSIPKWCADALKRKASEGEYDD